MNTPDEIKKVYWSISEVAEMMEVTQSQIRFWLRKFNVEVKRFRGGAKDRGFTESDIEKVKEIKRLLKEELYTIEGAVKKFKC